MYILEKTERGFFCLKIKILRGNYFLHLRLMLCCRFCKKKLLGNIDILTVNSKLDTHLNENNMFLEYPVLSLRIVLFWIAFYVASLCFHKRLILFDYICETSY